MGIICTIGDSENTVYILSRTMETVGHDSDIIATLGQGGRNGLKATMIFAIGRQTQKTRYVYTINSAESPKWKPKNRKMTETHISHRGNIVEGLKRLQ